MTTKQFRSLPDSINQLDSNQLWAVGPDGVITYQVDGLARSTPNSAGAGASDGLHAMTPEEHMMAEAAFKFWDDLIAPHLVEVHDGDANISLNYTTNAPVEYAGTKPVHYAVTQAYDPNGENLQLHSSTLKTIAQADIWIPDWSQDRYGVPFTYLGPVNFGDFTMSTYEHELGHALGLDHFDVYGLPDPNHLDQYTYANKAHYLQDSVQFTIMSYWKETETGTGADYTRPGGPVPILETHVRPQTPMLYDVLAIQAMYGADMHTRLGDTVYGFHSSFGTTGADSVYNFDVNSTPVLTIYDAGGNDTFDVSGFQQNQFIDLRPGYYSSVGGMSQNVAMAFNVGPNGYHGFNANAVIENAVGGSGNDTIIGNDADNILHGGYGNDTLIGGLGNNDLYGEDDNDTLVGTYDYGAFGIMDGGAGNDTADFSSFQKAIVVDLGGNYSAVQESDGWYDLANLVSIENVIGGANDDQIWGDDGANRIDGGDGSDTIHGGGGADILIGQAGDTVYGDGGGDTLVATYAYNFAFEAMDGGDGIDTADFSGFPVAVRVDLGSGQAWTTDSADLSAGTLRKVASLTAIENVTGGAGDDELTGDGGNNTIDGGDGNDTIHGGGGNDYLLAGTGVDMVYGDGGDDLLGVSYEYNFAFDILDGGEGNDTADFSVFVDAVRADLTTGEVRTTDTADLSVGTPRKIASLVSIENLDGGYGDDDLTGDGGKNYINGGDGNDTIHGGGGNDTLLGGYGVDMVYGEGGDDTLLATYEYNPFAFDIMDGGEGTDTADFSEFGAAIRVDLAAAAPEAQTSDTADLSIGALHKVASLVSIENVTGGSGDDELSGNDGANRIDGGAGNDTIHGGGDNDILIGGIGIDSVYGEGGDDTLVATYDSNPFGFDLMDGGEGTDTADFGSFHNAIRVDLAADAPAAFTTDTPDLASGTLHKVASLVSIENLIGGAGKDELSGNGGVNHIAGGAGDDVIHGGEGNDVLTGGYASRADAKGFDGNDTIYGDGGDDVITVLWGNDKVHGGDGTDTLSFAEVKADLTLDLSAGSTTYVEGGTFFDVSGNPSSGFVGQYTVTWDGIENLTGGVGNDEITGDSNNNKLDGGIGSDTAVFHGTRSSYTITTLNSGGIQVADTLAGRDGTDSVYSVEFLRFADGTYSAVDLQINHVPVLAAADQAVAKNTSLAASSLFQASDADGDGIARYQLWDATPDATSGLFVLDGVAQGANRTIDVSTVQLAQTTFQTGSTPDDLWARAYDGAAWSDWKEFHLTPPVNHAPVVAVADQNVAKNASLTASSLFSVSDADGDAMSQYHFWDSTADATSGHFVVNGVAQAAGQTIMVSAAQLAQTSYQGGTTADDLWVQAYDGAAWSGWKEFHLIPPVNHAPIITTTDQSVAKNASLAASSLFSVSDADGDAMTQYHFWDATADSTSGHFAINGVTQAANQVINVTAAQLAQTTFQTGSTPDDLWARAYDGAAWSDWKEFHLTPPVNHAPVVAVADQSVAKNASLAASSLFSVSDADGDAMSQYHFWDSTADATSGHFVVNGVAQAAGQTIMVSAAQLAQTSYQGGTTADDLWVQAYDGAAWSGWKEFHLIPPVNHAPIITTTDQSVAKNASLAASSLFSVSDADGDAMTQYHFWDATADATSGHFAVNGVAQGASQVIDVSAADLANATFQTGATADDLWVQAYDGAAWSGWKEFHLTSPVNHAPVVVSAADHILPESSATPASSLFSVNDPDGDPIRSYQLFDATADSASGHFVVDGVAQGASQVITVSDTQLARSTFQTGTAADLLWARAFDGAAWSGWVSFSATPVHAIVGTEGADVLRGDATDNVLKGLGGDDELIGLQGRDVLDGGPGVDTANYSASPAGVSINLANGTGHGGDAEGDTLISIEQAIGSGFDDSFQGSADRGKFLAGDGNDTMIGGSAYDWFEGGNGNDTFTGTGGFMVMFGGDGNDTMTGSLNNGNYFEGGLGNDVMTGGNTTDYMSDVSGGDDIMHAGGGDDSLVDFYGVTALYGEGGNDQVAAAACNGLLDGGAGNDYVTASSGNYTLFGGAGNDTLEFAGFGSATFTGGADADIFTYRVNSGPMTVTDFQDGIDHIYLWDNHYYGTVPFESLTIADSAQGAVISWNGGSPMTLTGIRASQLTHADFVDVAIGNGGSSEIAGPSRQAVTFAGTGSLILDDASSFSGTVAGLADEDSLDLRDISFATLQGQPRYSGDSSGGTLSVGDGTHMANIALLGSYMASSFVTASDGHGGTLISETAQSATQMPIVTQPHA